MTRPGRILFVLVAALSVAIGSDVISVEPVEMMDDPALEARARVISKDLRCVVCQNETIDESHASLAQDMRRVVRQRITAGDTNEDVIAYMVGRYGDFVLLRPRMTSVTWLLWFGPIVLLLFGALIVIRYLQPRVAVESKPLSDGEMDQLKILLSKKRER